MADAGIRPEIAAVVERIDELRPMLNERGRDGDQLRRLPDDVFAALAKTGAFSASAPTRFGGLAASTRECHAIARAIGRGDGGASWICGILSTGAWVSGLMDDRAQEDMWGPAGAQNTFVSIVLAPTSEAVPVDGGYRVTGRWGYGTASLHSQWSVLGIPLKNETTGATEGGVVLIPNSELTYEDNWYVAGMKASGSVTQIADDVFVPSHRVFALGPASEGTYQGSNPEQTYRTAFVPSLFMKLVGPHLGMGRAALDYAISKAESKAVAFTGYKKQAESVSFQLAIAKASVMLNGAEQVARQLADEIYTHAGRGYYAPYSERIEMRARAGWVIETITDIMNQVVTAHGSGGFADASLLQRMWRDQAVAARHGHALSASGYEAYGKVLFGREAEARFVLPAI